MSDRYAGRAIAMVDAGAQREASAYVWNVWAVIHAHRGDWARAEKANATALERLGEVGDFNLEAEVWQMRSAIYLGSGAFGSAESAWSRHRSLAERKRNPQNLCWSLLDEAETRVARDETAAADRALDAALAIPTAPNDASSTIEKHYATAVVRAAQRRWPEAIESADAIIDMLERQPPSAFHFVDFCAGAVGVYFDALEDGCDRAATLRRAQRGCKVVRRAARQFGSVRARRWLLDGLLKWAEGDQAAARERWRRAEDLALRKGTHFELARARYEIARHSDAAAGQREAYLADAAATFERLGALQMLRRVREAQADDEAKGAGR
jgi:hypothetical protein